MSRAGACLGEGWGLSVAQRRGVKVRFEGAVAGECLVDGKPHRTICVFRVHLLPSSALKTLLASAMVQTSSFECEGARRVVGRQWQLSNLLHDSRAAGLTHASTRRMAGPRAQPGHASSAAAG